MLDITSLDILILSSNPNSTVIVRFYCICIPILLPAKKIIRYIPLCASSNRALHVLNITPTSHNLDPLEPYLLRKIVPPVVDLLLMFIDALCLVGMGLHEPVSRVIELLHLLSQGSQVTLQSLVFTLQALDRGKIVAEIIRLECGFLLIHPVFGLISITEQGGQGDLV